MVAACNDGKECKSIIEKMVAGIDPLTVSLSDSLDSFRGSEQEDKAQDIAYKNQKALTKLLTQLEEQMVPKGYATPVPSEYDDLPQLKKRATVEMVLNKGTPGAVFDVNGVNIKVGKLTMIIDGYAGTLYFVGYIGSDPDIPSYNLCVAEDITWLILIFIVRANFDLLIG